MTENKKIKPLEKIGKEVIERYNKHPSGWRFLHDAHHNILALGPRRGYRLKIMPITPKKSTGVGVKVNLESSTREEVQKLPPWGLRPISETEVRKLLLASMKNKQIPRKISKRLMERKPVPFKDKEEHNLLGPIAFPRDLNSIIKGQKKLERRLKRETYELFKQRYPRRAGKNTYT